MKMKIIFFTLAAAAIIVVSDARKVKLTCPKNITENIDENERSVKVKWAEKRMRNKLIKQYGDSATLTLLTKKGSGDKFKRGLTRVTYRATADGRRSSTCTFFVHVIVPECAIPSFQEEKSYIMYYNGKDHISEEPYEIRPRKTRFYNGTIVAIACNYEKGYLQSNISGPLLNNSFTRYTCNKTGEEEKNGLYIMQWLYHSGNNFTCVLGQCEIPEYNKDRKELRYLGQANEIDEIDFGGRRYKKDEPFNLFDLIHVGCRFEDGYVAVSNKEEIEEVPLDLRGTLMYCLQEPYADEPAEWQAEDSFGYSSLDAFECAYVECGYPEYDNESHVIYAADEEPTDGAFRLGARFIVQCNTDNYYYPVNEAGEENDTYSVVMCGVRNFNVAAVDVTSEWKHIYGNQFDCEFCPAEYGMDVCNGTQKCIPADWRCDNWDDCGDNEDEQGCSCLVEENKVWCNGTDKCIYESWLCDGDNDCLDMEDEQDCAYCGTNFTLCFGYFDLECIPNEWICDGEQDCEYGDDEKNCACDFQCGNGTCIPEEWVCDLVSDCENGYDEINCTCNTEDGKLFCGTGNDTCISTDWLCDGENDCGDWWDERNCDELCADDEMFCRYEFCVPRHYRCDGHHDCFYGEDEADCPCFSTDKVERFNCTESNKCILAEWTCDGVMDCEYGEDENQEMCAKLRCGETEFMCHTHDQCVSMDVTCDYQDNCEDGSDELNCDKIFDFEGHHVPLHRFGDTFVPACFDGWPQGAGVSNESADLACQHFGFGDAYGWDSIDASLVNESLNGFVNFELQFDEDGDVRRPVPSKSSSCPSEQIITLNCSFKQCGISTHKDRLWRPNILNGYDAELGEWPWQILLEYNGQHQCGGSILNPEWILTAAHCVEGAEFAPQRFSIRAGTTHLHGNGQSSLQSRTVEAIVMHPRYNPSNIWNDIALLKLQEPLKFNEYVRHICLPDDEEELDEVVECYSTGWGGINPYATSFPFILQEARFNLINDTACADNYYIARTGIFNAPRMQCAGYAHGFVTVCNGDSGGPLMCRDRRGVWTQFGVVSWGPVDGFTSCMGVSVFVEVLRYEAWIKNVIPNFD